MTKRTVVTGFHTNPERINRKGRPMEPWTWAGLIKAESERIDENEETGDGKRTIKESIVKAVVAKAMAGDLVAFKELSNRTDGMPTQQTDLNVKGTLALGAMLDRADGENPEENNED